VQIDKTICIKGATPLRTKSLPSLLLPSLLFPLILIVSYHVHTFQQQNQEKCFKSLEDIYL